MSSQGTAPEEGSINTGSNPLTVVGGSTALTVVTIPFALNPSDTISGIIDWTTPLGMEIHRSAKEPLSQEKFNGNVEDLGLFLTLFKQRGERFGWFDINKIGPSGVAIAMIPQDIEAFSDDPDSASLIDCVDFYGSVPVENVRAFAATYLFSKEIYHRRAQQDENLAFECLWNSVGTRLLQTLMVHKERWVVQDPDHLVPPKRSAILFLLSIISENCIQSNVTTSPIRTRLASLNEYILTVGSDIGVFNQYVEENLAALTTRGEQTYDLMVNLWRAYRAAEDAPCNAFVVRMNDDWNMGVATMTPQMLMNAALVYLKHEVQSKTWQQPTEADRTIIALKAELAAMNKRTAGSPKKTGKGKDKAGTGKKSGAESKPVALKDNIAPADFKRSSNGASTNTVGAAKPTVVSAAANGVPISPRTDPGGATHSEPSSGPIPTWAGWLLGWVWYMCTLLTNLAPQITMYLPTYLLAYIATIDNGLANSFTCEDTYIPKRHRPYWWSAWARSMTDILDKGIDMLDQYTSAWHQTNLSRSRNHKVAHQIRDFWYRYRRVRGRPRWTRACTLAFWAVAFALAMATFAFFDRWFSSLTGGSDIPRV